MFSAVQNCFESMLSYFGYGSKPSEGLPAEIHKSLENQELSTESTLQRHRVASTPPSIWTRVASMGMSYLVFSSGQSSLRETISFEVGGYVSEPWALQLTFVAGLSIFPNMVHAQSSQTTFFEVFGGTNQDRGTAITTTPEGNLFVVGDISSFGTGGDDVLLSKFSRNGTLIWTNILGGASNERGHALTFTSEGDLVVVGYTSSFGAGSNDVLLSKFSSNGTLLWANTLGGIGGDYGFDLKTTSEGDLIVTGYTDSFGARGDDVLLSKFSRNGTLIWTNILGGASDERGYALTVTSEGDFIVAGYTQSFGAGSNDVLLSKFSSNGTLLWANTLGGADSDSGNALTISPEGDLIFVGYTQSFGAGGNDVLLSKFSSNGTLLWANTLGGSNTERGRALTVTPEGDFIVAGYTSSFGAGNNDVLLSKFSSNGTLLWTNTLGGASNDYGVALKISSEGDLVVVGYISSFRAGGDDFLLAELNAYGVIENCSAWQSVTPQVQSITPNVTDVTQNMTTILPSYTVQDARDALNITDITNLLNQTTVCYAQTAGNQTFTTFNKTPLSNSQDTREFASVSSSPSMSRSPSVKTTDNSSLMSSLASRSSHSTLMQTNSAMSTILASTGVSRMFSQSSDRITSFSIPSPSRGGTIPSITVLVYEESYPIIVNGETIGTFYFTGGDGQLDGNNVNTLYIQLDGDIEDEETITLFTIPEEEELLWEDIVLSNGSESRCVTTEGVFTTSEEEHSYQLIFQHESSECSQYTGALKLSAIPVLGSGFL